VFALSHECFVSLPIPYLVVSIPTPHLDEPTASSPSRCIFIFLSAPKFLNRPQIDNRHSPAKAREGPASSGQTSQDVVPKAPSTNGRTNFKVSFAPNQVSPQSGGLYHSVDVWIEKLGAQTTRQGQASGPAYNDKLAYRVQSPNALLPYCTGITTFTLHDGTAPLHNSEVSQITLVTTLIFPPIINPIIQLNFSFPSN